MNAKHNTPRQANMSQTNTHQTPTPAQKSAKLFLQTALDFWYEKGYNPRTHLFCEAMDLQGKPLWKLDLRARVQTRFIFVYAFAYRFGHTQNPKHKKAAIDGFDALLRHFYREGGCVYAIDTQGNVKDGRVQAYEHAFVALAAAELYAITNNPSYETHAKEAWMHLERHMRAPKGGFYSMNLDAQLEKEEASKKNKDGAPIILEQNPHMHWLESALSWASLSDDPFWKVRAEELLNLFKAHFFDAKKGILREFFDVSWQPDALKGHLLEPGHHYEWSYLLHQYDALFGAPECKIYAKALYDYAQKHGLQEDGFVSFHTSSTPTKKAPKAHLIRFWAQTEAMRARCIHGSHKEADALWSGFLEIFLRMPKDENGNIVGAWWLDLLEANTHKDHSKHAPSTSFYHLISALDVYLQLDV